MTDITYEQAESLRKAKKYNEATEAFRSLWTNNPKQDVGWRYAHCLRKTGEFAQAEIIANEAIEQFPDNKWAKNELIWTLYDKELKPAKVDGDLERAIRFGKQTLSLNPEGLSLHKISLLVMKVAKSKSRWDIILEWADLLLNDKPSTQARFFNGKKGFSDSEIWYVARAKALYELGMYSEARTFTQKGLITHPKEVYLERTSALSLAKTGQLDEAIVEFKEILRNPKAGWYFKADLAELERQAGNTEKAYQLVCQSLIASRQGNEFKLGAFYTLAEIALDLEKVEIAAAHVKLSKNIRETKGWKLDDNLILLAGKIQTLSTEKNVQLSLPEKTYELTKLCEQSWQDAATSDEQRIHGTISFYSREKPFAFISPDDGGEDVYSSAKDIPSRCKKSGARVDFMREKSFDRKKNKNSFKASYIRCMDE